MSVQIEEMGEIRTFEAVPSEVTLYLTAVRYSGTLWSAGPSGLDKNEVINRLVNWSGIDSARIYSVKVPLTVPKAT